MITVVMLARPYCTFPPTTPVPRLTLAQTYAAPHICYPSPTSSAPTRTFSSRLGQALHLNCYQHLQKPFGGQAAYRNASKACQSQEAAFQQHPTHQSGDFAASDPVHRAAPLRGWLKRTGTSRERLFRVLGEQWRSSGCFSMAYGRTRQLSRAHCYG